MCNYYSVILKDKEYVFYTSRVLSEDEIIEWAQDYSYIKESDVPKCHSPRAISSTEIDKRNKILYEQWYNDREKRKALGEDVSYDIIPPTISAVQID
ncbi:hypothetical protein [Paraclostridium sordellii]|uniref:hypothetical protein n=1 Tax=Paraclostridium sordellii TaxID=1505 RepID=UPI000E5453FB|nr:hypothetical protein [Paeniclostridium sordellii]RGX06262.1 hypothetical protein DWV40_11470 [Paeniclostridium sordellii]